MKTVDIDEPASFLDHMYLGCTQRECKPDAAIIEQYTKMFKSRISAEATEKLPGWQKPHAQTVTWSYDTERHAQKCGERDKQESGATVQSFSSLFGRPSVQKKNWNQLENCQKFAHKLLEIFVFGKNWTT